jgi:hypothetical protein
VTDPKLTYQNGLDRVTRELAELNRRFARIGIARLGAFLIGVSFAVLAIANGGGLALVGVLVAVIGFAILIGWHEHTARARDRAARSAEYYRRGLARLEDRWLTGGDDGARFRNEAHLFASDLELFGRGSLFHLISVTRTESGAARLASWLASPASIETAVARQAAVAELASHLSLRHDLATVDAGSGSALDSDALRRWLATGPSRYLDWVAPGALGLAAVNLAATAGALAGILPGWAVLPGYLATIALTTAVRQRVAASLREVDRPARELVVIGRLLARVARERFDAPRLRALEAVWRATGADSVAEIRRLERIVDLVDARRNQLFLPISGLLLLGTQLALAIERWRRRVAPAALGWLDATAELEALSSLATHAFDHPADVFPRFLAEASLEARGLAHVLLPAGRAVRNDVSLGDRCRLLIVSGSNMSGKSTLLKAVGTNLVLAFAGAPVRATELVVGPLKLGASLVLRDSLLEGRSRFFAEILRLRDVVALASRGEPVLFLLDELLSGTNSHDRAIGARAVLLGLIDRGAIGLVTTHDLALTAIEQDAPDRVANRHFEDTLLDGKLEFDYRLKPGVVRRSNALELMRAVGLEVGPPTASEPDAKT